MKRMAYHLLAILILGMAASAVKAQILLTASATPIEEYAAVVLQRELRQADRCRHGCRIRCWSYGRELL